MWEVVQFWTIFVDDVDNRWQHWELKTILTADDDFDNFGIAGKGRVPIIKREILDGICH